jgi:hypothetical protein
MEMGCVAGQKDYRAWRISLEFVSVEFVAQADIEDAGNDRVYSIFQDGDAASASGRPAP